MKTRLWLLAGALLLVTPFFDRSAEGQGLQYYAVAPCRMYDTRGLTSAAGAGGGVINTATIRSFRLRNFCGVPSTAKAVSLNLTVVQPNAPLGDLRIAPYTAATAGQFPNVSTSNYVAGDTIANGAVVPLGAVANPGADHDFQVLAAGCAPCSNAFTFHLLIDVNGYFQ
jgi:hypothetical protein